MEYIKKALERRILDSADIVDVVGAFVELKRHGSGYIGLCPFHPDTNPSLSIKPKDNICRCFACMDKAVDPVGFLQKMGMSFHDALVWIANQNKIPVNGSIGMNVTTMETKPRKPKAEPLYLDLKMAEERVGNYELNPFAQWVKHLPWYSVLQKASVEYWLKEYYVGTSVNGSTRGWTIWWQIDALNRLLTGKMMKYKEDGHRDRDAQYSITSVHYLLQKAGQLNLEGKEAQSCLFGLHLVFKYDFKTVCIVESEKSAIVAQIFNTDTERVFVATGGKGKLNSTLLRPLIQKGCDIILYPDIDATEEWTRIAKDIDYKNICVTKNIQRLYDPTKDSPKADIADILVRILEEKRDEVFIRDSKTNAEI